MRLTRIFHKHPNSRSPAFAGDRMFNFVKALWQSSNFVAWASGLVFLHFTLEYKT